jgi:transposase-like protein
MSGTDSPEPLRPPAEGWTMEQMTDAAQHLLEGQSVEEVSRATGVPSVQLESIRRQLIKSGLAKPEGSGTLGRSGVFIERVEELLRSSGGFLRKALHRTPP